MDKIGRFDNEFYTTLKAEYETAQGVEEKRLKKKEIDAEEKKREIEESIGKIEKLILQRTKEFNQALNYAVRNLRKNNPNEAIRCLKKSLKIETSIKNLYAIGDVVGKNWLAHTAMREGEVAAANALGEFSTMKYDAVPSVVFTDPEIAAVGLLPHEAKSLKIPVKKGRFYYAASGKALCDGSTEGFVEIISEPGRGTILGGWIVGESASTLICEITLAVTHKLTVREIMEVIHAHPTLSEIVFEAVADCQGRAIHKVR